MGWLGWLGRFLKLFGGRRRQASGARMVAVVPPVQAARVVAVPTDPAAFKASRKRMVAYVAQARVPIRQTAAVRTAWLHDLGKVYAAIASAPTQVVLEQAGRVGEDHEPAFREALALAQAIETPPEAEACHAALVGWITALDSACLALMDARKLKDRSLLGSFREQLGKARRCAVQLVDERRTLFATWKLAVRPTIQRRVPRAQPEAEPESETPSAQPRRGAPKPGNAQRPPGKGGQRRRTGGSRTSVSKTSPAA